MRIFFLSFLISIFSPLLTHSQAGIPDSTFDDDGITIFNDADGFGQSYSVGLQPDGKIVVVGRSEIQDTLNFLITRLLTDGSVDASFNPTYLKVSTSDWFNDVVISPGGEIFASAISYNNQYDQHFVVLKYETDG